MNSRWVRHHALATGLAFLASGPCLPGAAGAHCDAMDGPVVREAGTALEQGDVTPVLKWVEKAREGEVRVAFQKALAVRNQGPEARELADTYFYETLVRIHRAGEGEPFTGLQPAGRVAAGIAAADGALQQGSIDEVVEEVRERVEAGIRARFTRAVEAKRHASESVESGREFVAAYVDFIHYVERLHQDAMGHAAHAEGAGAAGEYPH